MSVPGGEPDESVAANCRSGRNKSGECSNTSQSNVLAASASLTYKKRQFLSKMPNPSWIVGPGRKSDVIW